MFVEIVRAPDAIGMTLEDLIEAGILEPDWQERQEQLLRELHVHRLLHRPKPGKSASETLIEMREEETR